MAKILRVNMKDRTAKYQDVPDEILDSVYNF